MKPKILINAHMKKEFKKTHMIPTLTLAIFLSLAVAVLTVSSLESEDRITLQRGLFLSVLGAIFFTSLYSSLNQAAQRTNAGQKVVKKYKLSIADILDFSNKVVSAVQAVFSCLAGVSICSYSCPRNLLKTSHFLSEAYAWFGASYFMYDIWSMYQVHCHTAAAPCQQNGDVRRRNSGLTKFMMYVRHNPIIVGHHLFIGVFGFSVIIYLRGGLGDCVFGYVYLMEASTPFVSLRGILSRFGMKATKWYVFNGLAMLVVFFLCRIAMFPYVMYLYAQAAGMKYLDALMSLPRNCKITMSILVLPQIYWFILMLRGATQVLNPKKVGNVTTTNAKRRKNNNVT